MSSTNMAPVRHSSWWRKRATGLLAIGAFARSRRGHMRDRLAVTDARHGLAAFDRSGEVHRISLGFDGLHGTTHGKFNQLA